MKCKICGEISKHPYNICNNCFYINKAIYIIRQKPLKVLRYCQRQINEMIKTKKRGN